MPEEVNYNELSELDFLKKIVATMQKQNSNLDNTLPLMRNGHFIDAFYRITGTKESVNNLWIIAGERLQYLMSKGNSVEDNSNN
jgi:hypothetical protein